MTDAKIFLTADLHLGHAALAERRGFASLSCMHDCIYTRWQEAVAPHDTVWVLGDVTFRSESIPLLGRLNGIKRLIMGNHDELRGVHYDTVFKTREGNRVTDGVVFTHFPVHPYLLEGSPGPWARWRGNVHGHLHADHIPDDPRYVCVSVEQTAYKPVLLDDVIKKIVKN